MLPAIHRLQIANSRCPIATSPLQREKWPKMEGWQATKESNDINGELSHKYNLHTDVYKLQVSPHQNRLERPVTRRYSCLIQHFRTIGTQVPLAAKVDTSIWPAHLHFLAPKQEASIQDVHCLIRKTCKFHYPVLGCKKNWNSIHASCNTSTSLTNSPRMASKKNLVACKTLA